MLFLKSKQKGTSGKIMARALYILERPISKMPIVWPKFQKCPELFIKFQKCPNLCGKFQKCPNLRQKCQFCPNISRKFHFCPKLLSKFQKRQRSRIIPASSFRGMTNQTIQTIVSKPLLGAMLVENIERRSTACLKVSDRETETVCPAQRRGGPCRLGV